MKKCPKCNLTYSDNTLEFCLEDGSRLFSISPTQTTEKPKITYPANSTITTEKTVNLPSSNVPGTLEFQTSKNIQPDIGTDYQQIQSKMSCLLGTIKFLKSPPSLLP